MILLKIKFGGYLFIGISILIGLILVIGHTYDFITGNWRIGGKPIDAENIIIRSKEEKNFRLRMFKILKKVVAQYRFKSKIDSVNMQFYRTSNFSYEYIYPSINSKGFPDIGVYLLIKEINKIIVPVLKKHLIKDNLNTISLWYYKSEEDYKNIPLKIRKEKMLNSLIKFIENKAIPFFSKTKELPYVLKIIDNTRDRAKVFHLMSSTWAFKEITIRRLCGDPKYEEKKMELLASCERAAKIEHGLYKNYPAAFKELCEILDKMEPRYSYHPERLGDVSEFVPKGPDEYPARRSFQPG